MERWENRQRQERDKIGIIERSRRRASQWIWNQKQIPPVLHGLGLCLSKGLSSKPLLSGLSPGFSGTYLELTLALRVPSRAHWLAFYLKHLRASSKHCLSPSPCGSTNARRGLSTLLGRCDLSKGPNSEHPPSTKRAMWTLMQVRDPLWKGGVWKDG